MRSSKQSISRQSTKKGERLVGNAEKKEFSATAMQSKSLLASLDLDVNPVQTPDLAAKQSTEKVSGADGTVASITDIKQKMMEEQREN